MIIIIVPTQRPMLKCNGVILTILNINSYKNVFREVLLADYKNIYPQLKNTSENNEYRLYDSVLCYYF